MSTLSTSISPRNGFGARSFDAMSNVEPQPVATLDELHDATGFTGFDESAIPEYDAWCDEVDAQRCEDAASEAEYRYWLDREPSTKRTMAFADHPNRRERRARKTYLRTQDPSQMRRYSEQMVRRVDRIVTRYRKLQGGAA